MNKKTVFILILFILFLWNLLIFSAPIFVFFNLNYLSELIHYFFSFFCHQFEHRSFCFYGSCLPVCTRCTAIYLAMFLGVITFYFKNKFSSKNPNIIYFFISLIPIGIDGFGQLLGFWESSNLIRIFTGIIFGFVFPFYFIPFIFQFIEKKEKIKKENIEKKEKIKKRKR
jgi:uncharacterized membrane protein